MKKLVLLYSCFAFGPFSIHATEEEKPAIVITAPAKLKTKDEWVYLTISDATNSFEIPWAMPPNYHGRVALRHDRLYTFTIVEEPTPRGRLFPNVVRVEQAGKVLYDRKVCLVHQVKMEPREVEIIYGLILPGPGEPSEKTTARLFPHRHEIALGGCVSGPDSPKSKKVYVCAKCKEAYDKWIKEHPKTK